MEMSRLKTAHFLKAIIKYIPGFLLHTIRNAF